MMTDANIISILAWTIVSVFGALMGILSWLAVRLINQNDRIEAKIDAGHRANVDQFHKLDLRVTALEAWRNTQALK